MKTINMCCNNVETFHPLVTTVEVPERLNNPFDYEPHPLTLLAAETVRRKLADMPQWADEVAAGKMFGVLVCADVEGRLGFLAAYSGQIGGREDWLWFVPAVFDYLQPDGYFKQEEARITDINRRVDALEHDPQYLQLCSEQQTLSRQAESEIAAYQTMMREAKQRRDELRGTVAEEQLIRESQFQKAELRRLKRRWAEKKESLHACLQPMKETIDVLKNERKRRSDNLQRWLFDQFVMRNAEGEQRTLTDIFANVTPVTTPHEGAPVRQLPIEDAAICQLPPAGAGECCAPKLLQYAFLHHLKPLCIGEFWQGRSPKMEIRHHDQFYPACRGKCKPILEWMLGDLLPLTPRLSPLTSQLSSPTPRLVYADDSLLVIDKPSGLLSVPGRSDMPSVESLLRRDYPEVYMVHRLDMDTSGLMVAALTQETYRHLQRQFLGRTINKRYEALLDGVVGSGTPVISPLDDSHGQPASGTISLPLRPDPFDRPRQVVDHEHGKTAVTDFRVIAFEDGCTRVVLTPHTGRTHQLRVHCAHAEGLATPIVGDNLYGHPNGRRLCLHATTLAFTHPKTGQRLQFESPPPF